MLVATIEHKSQHHFIQSTGGHDWKILLFNKSEDPDATKTLVFNRKAITISANGQSKNLFQRIVPTNIKFSIEIRDAADEAILNDIIAADENEYYVKVYRDDVFTFAGYVLRDQIIIQDSYFPYGVELQALDGLSLLSEYDYKAPDDTAFTGQATILEHVLNCLKTVYVDELYDDNQEILGVSLAFYENNMGDLLGCPAAQTRVDHQAFTEWEERTYYEVEIRTILFLNIPFPVAVNVTEPVNFTNAYDVLEQILLLFNARIVYEQGVYHIVTLNNYVNASYRVFYYDKSGVEQQAATWAHNITHDRGYTYATAGRTFTFLQPVKRVIIDHELGQIKNLIDGFVWNYENETIICGLTTLDHTTGDATLDINIPILLEPIERNDFDEWPNFRYLFKATIKVGDTWLKRTYDGADSSGEPLYSEVSWSTSEAWYYFASPKLLDYHATGQPFPVVNLSLITPPIVSSGELCFGVEFVAAFGSVIYSTSGIFTSVDYVGDPYNFEFYFGYKAERGHVSVISEATDINQDAATFIRYTSDVALRNTKEIKEVIKIGDDAATQNNYRLQIHNGSDWVDSESWYLLGTPGALKIGALLAQSMASLRANLKRVMKGSFIFKERMCFPSTRITSDGYTYIQLLGGYNSELETVTNGEWIEVISSPGKTTIKASNKIQQAPTAVEGTKSALNTVNLIKQILNGDQATAGYNNYLEWSGADMVNNTYTTTGPNFPNPAAFTDTEINKKVLLTINGAEMRHGDYTQGRNIFTINPANLKEIKVNNVRATDFFKMRYNE